MDNETETLAMLILNLCFSKYSAAKRRSFFDQGASWAKNVTIFSRTLRKATRRSTRINALNSKASPGE